MPTDAETAAERFPRRSARRLQTRARILEAALEQFKRVGYADATMNAIADAADVHVTTLFTHFRTKRDLAANLGDAEILQLEKLIAEARGKVPFFDFFRRLVLATARSRQTDGDPKMGLGRELQQDPELALGWLRYEERQVVLLADYIAQDYGLDAKADYAPYMAAHVLITSGVVSYTRWRTSDGLDLAGETARALDLAEAMARSILPKRPN